MGAGLSGLRKLLHQARENDWGSSNGNTSRLPIRLDHFDAFARAYLRIDPSWPVAMTQQVPVKTGKRIVFNCYQMGKLATLQV